MSSPKPPPFSHLIGNEKAKTILRRLLAHEALPTTLLFHGPQGVGKSHFALEVARHLVASDKKEHPDIHLILPDPKSDQHPVANIRALLEEAGYPPYEAPAKIFIIDDADKMLPTSSNTLLKTLEEPPPRIYFILLTSQPTSLLPTIISRCCRVPFFPIPEEEIAAFLAEKHLSTDGKKIALLSEGSLQTAIRRASHPSQFPAAELLRAKWYNEIFDLLARAIPEELSDQEADQIFEEILYALRETQPFKLEKAVPLIIEARGALFQHVKLKNVLEQVFLALLDVNI
jgi:DNA polymerase III gamma/tau subunit